MTEDEIKSKAEELQKTLFELKKRSDSVLSTYRDSPTYTITDSKGSVKDYKYFLYPFKNFSDTKPADEQFIAKHLADFIDKTVDYLVTFEADGIGITKLISVITGIPMLVCKPFHYHQPVFSFQQKTGYFERTMHCPKLIAGKRIAIVDCIVSTGGTVKGFLEALDKEDMVTEVEGVYAVVNKTNYQEPNIFGTLKYRSLFNVIVEDDGRVTSAISDNFREAFWKEINTSIMNFARLLATQSDLSRNDFKVGSVLMDDVTFEILGWGCKGPRMHAEDNAIQMAKRNFPLQNRIIVIYTTLEPCVYRNIEGMKPCSNIISEIPEIHWVVIDQKDDEDPKNFHYGIEALKKASKYVVCFESHPSIALNYSPELSAQKEFTGEV
jgi:adenine phosphoribosyltransferase